ncbi:hypothetical protein I6J18_02800 [Peribacillus psychrosaccharolyticus]|uniref:Uncharacterized protein n=1 Tax=Peribacillus psychrosaccharolyticus TaxID=1407 RepID=A0A974S0P7_PERPY|nr:hypothetical protein [Peribacillus psychrosaccharolyticus]MEC2055916.1 hypothetical protein [Peribacillus psychrosaccharolyticus]MED3743091.1 hypothetical protein [Peribacillus psychrosaccharolyticus]QQT00867.1 hypothetical protein I6J18_02800 [Peribacillus psychrosaccharolyticus]
MLFCMIHRIFPSADAVFPSGTCLIPSTYHVFPSGPGIILSGGFATDQNTYVGISLNWFF